jgi:hypothetical protein
MVNVSATDANVKQRLQDVSINPEFEPDDKPTIFVSSVLC